MYCNVFYPLKADVYYGDSTQTDFGDLSKEWNYDHSIMLSLNMSTNYKDQNIQPEQEFYVQDQLNGRTPFDPRVSEDGDTFSMTNVLITNIVDGSNNPVYVETAGVREGLSTLYEISGVLPHNGPLGKVDYYKVVISRSDNQELVD